MTEAPNIRIRLFGNLSGRILDIRPFLIHDIRPDTWYPVNTDNPGIRYLASKSMGLYRIAILQAYPDTGLSSSEKLVLVGYPVAAAYQLRTGT